MKAFMDKDFLLSTKTAQRLYHEVAAGQPIFDYHCHLSPKEIAENKRFSNLAEIWLGGDHYKWRALRSNGVDERLITGDAEPYEKYQAWAATLPRLLGNPLYHWTHLELQRYFGIHEALDETSAKTIWDTANEKLASDDLSVYGILKNFKVYAVGTTDDPADSLEWHAKIQAEAKTETKVLPSFRPDKAIHLDKAGFPAYIEQLGAAAGISIQSFADLLSALSKRIAFFDQMGCRASDHALEYAPFEDAALAKGAEKAADKVFKLALSGGSPSQAEADLYKTLVLAHLGGEYAKHGWAMQIHLAALRNNSSRMFRQLGPDTGFDASHDSVIAAKLSKLLDLLDSRNQLPKTILYSLNPKDYYSLGTLMGAYQGGGIPGKIQLGSAWWFCDHKDGMSEQMRILGNVGLLPRFVGMLTDSRSFLSYPRHEYFRRILCDILGRWVEDGEIPSSPKLLDAVVADISFANAQRYFAK
ncbi:glucuronate isomerase [Treponema sp.]